MINGFPVTWRQGEHVVVVGRTGSGKTYLISKLIELRRYVVLFRTKPDSNKFPTLETVRHATAMQHWRGERLLLEPEYKRQAIEGYAMLDNAWHDGGWTLFVDELWYCEDQLGLRDPIVRNLTQGRSKDITMVMGVQRPVDISRFSLSETKHLFIFQTEGRDLKFSLRDSTTDRIVPAVRNLKRYQFVYYNRETGQLAIGDAKQLPNVFVSTYKPETLDRQEEPVRIMRRDARGR